MHVWKADMIMLHCGSRRKQASEYASQNWISTIWRHCASETVQQIFRHDVAVLSLYTTDGY